MINHFRTLLANLPPAPGDDATPGDEYIPPDFAPQAIPLPLRDLYLAFIPAGSSRESVNRLVFTLLQEAQAPDFEEFVTALDGRTTYSLTDETVLRKTALGEVVDSGNFQNKLAKVVAAAIKAENSNSLFLKFHPYEDQIAELRSIYGGAPTKQARVTAALIALVYQLERHRLLRGV